MKAVWLKGLKGTAREKRKQEVLAFRYAFDELRKVLEQEYKKKSSVRDYDTPNWEYQQVAVNEYNQVLEDMLKLITIDKE
jgi:hypothetical protein